MARLKKIQNWMKTNNIDLFLLNRTDEFNNEYIAPYAERLKWLSDFSGSAGKLIIDLKKGRIFVDGRYTLQVKQEVDKNLFKISKLENYWKLFERNLSKKITLAIDPKLHSTLEILKIIKIIKKKKSEIIYLNNNPIDKIWKNQPTYPNSLAFIHPDKYSGKSTKEKILEIQSTLKRNSINFYLLTSLDSIAWLLNIRGNDIKYTPLLLSYVIIPSKGKVEFFIQNRKIKFIKNKLNQFVNFHSFNDIPTFLKNLNKSDVIGMDPKKTNYFLFKICEAKNLLIKYFEDPCTYPKAQKNFTELSGARRANIRDGVSLTKFIFWLKNKMIIRKTDEIKAAKYLEKLRKKNKFFYSLSFSTISAVGKNAALPHYKLTQKSNTPFKKNMIYLFDSGSQYFDGTTDITRTIILGKPTKEQKDRFTRVLKGHISLAIAEFSLYSKGSSLDSIARKSLKEIKCDYDHGTGHGIGSFLSVHEGPQRISKMKYHDDVILKEGMIISNEPGFYKKNSYGIRIENLMIVCKNKNNLQYFETISFAPIDKDLIDKELLNKEEINWLNNYHKDVFLKISPKLKDNEKKWLFKVTQPL